jgi:hypothetical protein
MLRMLWIRAGYNTLYIRSFQRYLKHCSQQSNKQLVHQQLHVNIMKFEDAKSRVASLPIRQEAAGWTKIIIPTLYVSRRPTPNCYQIRCVRWKVKWSWQRQGSDFHIQVNLKRSLGQWFLTFFFFCAMDPSDSLVKPTDPFSEKFKCIKQNT